MDWSISKLLTVALIGLLGGTLCGLLGLGGSVFIIPALTLLLGSNYHLYQAAALVANVFVASAATLRHRGRGTLRMDIVPVMAASTACAALLGVYISNAIPSSSLYVVFGGFLCYASVAELVSLARATPDHPEVHLIQSSAQSNGLISEIPATSDSFTNRRPTRWVLACTIGTIGGFASGLLGIGGGAIMVPLLRKFGKLPLRQAVASSAAAMIVACSIGAIAKNASLHSLIGAADGSKLTLQESLTLALVLSPAAMVGGSLGAALVYRLPIVAIRVVLALLLAFAGVRMIQMGFR